MTIGSKLRDLDDKSFANFITKLVYDCDQCPARKQCDEVEHEHEHECKEIIEMWLKTEIGD